MKIKSRFKHYIFNSIGKKTDEKILVIESDDWGSIRSSNVASNKCKAFNDPFLKYDRLECSQDLISLYEVLYRHIDRYNNPAVITANYVMRNPDFDAINACKKYRSESFVDSYKRYYGNNNEVFSTILEGVNKKCFVPQLHALEHLNVNRWYKDYLAEKEDVIDSFILNMVGNDCSFSQSNHFGYMDELNYDDINELKDLQRDIERAVFEFKTIFGYESKTFIPSCFVWNQEIEKLLSLVGIKYIQSTFYHLDCTKSYGTQKMNRVYNHTGQINKFGQMYTIRNCEFEPCMSQDLHSCVNDCLYQIESAFHHHVPAIINSHRINYVGDSITNHSQRCLAALDELLFKVHERWPDCVFLSTPELINRLIGA